jgi:hypothetical protein
MQDGKGLEARKFLLKNQFMHTASTTALAFVSIELQFDEGDLV